MSLFLNMLLNGVLQVIMFALIPLIWWAMTSRKEVGFLTWIGFKKVKSEDTKRCWLTVGIIVIGFLILSIFTLYCVKDVATATSLFDGMGIVALPAALVYAFINTSLSEEIFFRGFLLKRLSSRYGFQVANVVQSLIFGLAHGVMFFSMVGVFKAIVIILFTGGIAWAMGYVNEKHAGGSILPSWFIHGLANTFAACLAMFSLFQF